MKNETKNKMHKKMSIVYTVLCVFLYKWHLLQRQEHIPLPLLVSLAPLRIYLFLKEIPLAEDVTA